MPGFATPDALRSVGRGFAYGYVVERYVEFFRAGLSLDIEARLRIFGLTTKEHWKKYDEAQLQRLEEQRQEWLKQLAAERAVTVKQLVQQQQRESQTVPVERHPRMFAK